MIDKNNLLLLGIAASQAVSAYYTFKAHQTAKGNAEVIVSLEKNTNSIKDALVESTGKAAFAEGRAEGKRSGEQTAKELLEYDQARADRSAKEK